MVCCKWIFKKNDALPGEQKVKFKARLVAQGRTQVERVDYTKIFSPVVKHTSIRLLLALVAQFNLELEQFDVKTTLLHGHLEEKSS